MSDVDAVAKILEAELDAGPAHARIVARTIIDRLFGAAADGDEPLAVEVADNRCVACGQAVPEYGGIILDRDRAEVRFGGKRKTLTGRELEVFDMMISRHGRVVRNDEFMSQLYQLSNEDEPDEKIIDVFICKLRAKLAPLGLTISTAWGRGYWLEEPGKKEIAA